MIESFLKQISIKTDTIEMRKNIVYTYVKNVIVYADRIVILFNYTSLQTDNTIDYEWIEKQFQNHETALTIYPSLDIQESFPPIVT